MYYKNVSTFSDLPIALLFVKSCISPGTCCWNDINVHEVGEWKSSPEAYDRGNEN